MFRQTLVRVPFAGCAIFATAMFLSCGGSSSPQKPTLQSIVVSLGNAQLFASVGSKVSQQRR